jgi:glycosyltransferase involved in cell wall biosynthesis
MCAHSARLATAPCQVVHDGLPLIVAPDAAARRAARIQLDLPSDKTLVLFAGQIIERKGVADLLRAWQQLPQPVRDRAELLIVGDDLQNSGAYRLEMQELAAQLNSPAKFFGFQSNVGQWLTAADVAVVPSHVEPLGNATLEAMAHALPLIGSDVGGIPEVIVHGETGLLVSPRDPEMLAVALERLLNSPEERRRLGEAGRLRCEMHFSIDAHVDKMVEQYRLAMATVQSPALA